MTPGGRSWTGAEAGDNYPHDSDDLGACEATYLLAPDDLRARMLPVLEKFRVWVTEGVNRYGVQIVDRAAETQAVAERATNRLNRLLLTGTIRVRYEVTVPEAFDPDEVGLNDADLDPEIVPPDMPGLVVHHDYPDYRFPYRRDDGTLSSDQAVITVAPHYEISVLDWLNHDTTVRRYLTYMDDHPVSHVIDMILDDVTSELDDGLDAYLDWVPTGWADNQIPEVTVDLNGIATGFVERLTSLLTERYEKYRHQIVNCPGQANLFDDSLVSA